jgi:glycosyltransferase involved in cell wall biosynthesis
VDGVARLPVSHAPDRVGQRKCERSAADGAADQQLASGEVPAQRRVRLGDVAAAVLFLHSSAGRYGADRQLLALAAGLDRSRFTPVAILPERGELAGPLEQAGVEVLVAPLAVLRRAELGPRGAWRVLRPDVREVERLARERDAALIHSNTSVIASGRPLARALGIPHVQHVRELYPRVPIAWPLWRRQLLAADRLLCVSQAVAAQFPDSDRTAVVHDGLPEPPQRADRAAARAALGIPGGTFAVAVLGRVSSWKGQDVLARALAEAPLASLGAVGLVAGAPWPGAERPADELERLRDELSLGDRLRVLGFRPDLDALLGAVDAVAVPSTRPDPFPNAALEAAAAGVPVVAAAHGGLPEMLHDGETGVLVPPGEPAALASALRSLADDPGRARRIGAAAADDVAARFSAERMLAAVQTHYDALLR